jgi:hypothetical protein
MIARGPSLAQTVADTSNKAGTPSATILQNPVVKDLISETEKRCHGCAITAVEGDLAGSEGRAVVIFVQDSGVSVRIARIKLESGIDVVYVVIP